MKSFIYLTNLFVFSSLFVLPEISSGQEDRLDNCQSFKVQTLGGFDLVEKDNEFFCFRNRELIQFGRSVDSELIEGDDGVDLVHLREQPGHQTAYEISWYDLKQMKLKKTQRITLHSEDVFEEMSSTGTKDVLILVGTWSLVLWDTKSNLVSVAGWDGGRFFVSTDWITSNEIKKQFKAKFNPNSHPLWIQGVDCLKSRICVETEISLEHLTFPAGEITRGTGASPWKGQGSAIPLFVNSEENEKFRESCVAVGFSNQPFLSDILYELGTTDKYCWQQWDHTKAKNYLTSKTFTLPVNPASGNLCCSSGVLSVITTVSNADNEKELGMVKLFQLKFDAENKWETKNVTPFKIGDPFFEVALQGHQVFTIQGSESGPTVFRHDAKSEMIGTLKVLSSKNKQKALGAGH